jgi:pulcherriminic acid synthase
MTTQQTDKGGPSAQPPTEKITIGRNGIAISPPDLKASEFRTFEIFQRQRVHQTTEKINGAQLISDAYLNDPYPLLKILREDYPCYRDWIGNSYWITRYDDVTSLFVDDANFETRPKRWFYRRMDFGRDLREALPVLYAQANALDAHLTPIAENIVTDFSKAGTADLATDFAARYPIEILAKTLDLPADDIPMFASAYWRMQRGVGANPQAEKRGRQAMDALCDYFEPLFAQRRADPGDDLISAIANLEIDGPATTPADLVATLLEDDHETLQGGLANMWFLLLTHPNQLELVRDDQRQIRFAYFETLRHSTPVLTAKRFARHEVERFGQLLPDGALMMCSAAAGNRDPRIYADPDKFMVERKDMCQREPRGMYRADGLPAGIAFGLGAPTKYPAVPEDRPRSKYALTRDAVVAASRVLLDSAPNLQLAPDASPALRTLALGEMHTCWNLPIKFDA